MLASNSLPMVPGSRNAISGVTSNDLRDVLADASLKLGPLEALPRLDEQAQDVEPGLGVEHLGLEVDDVPIEEHQVLELVVVDVHAAHLEEADRAPGVTHHRENRPGLIAAARARHADQVARVPAQERRDVVVEQRRHDHGADGSFRHRLAARLVDHLAQEQVGPHMQAVVLRRLDRDQRAFGHAELVGNLSAPGSLELLALGR